ncbi:DNA polymerase III subunit beta [Leptolyngbya sp. FACHB-261]|uniref:DNA polymerase III subunit beta n=1 Tax=Leptolyngbya sp. FACHB-261 TaxID=2692806 RepID=UPI001683DE67|nr:DNA polymerase III subunit beta [Leptolyngbya sp. FACHB-261]MBD2101522.1 DNA polymerase III subunit beta [Leptolyngbya sp. FACHB-261]
MKLICSQAALSQNLSLVSRAVASRPSHPVLAHVLLNADEERQEVSVTAFDLNLGIRVSFEAQVLEAGSVTLPARLLSDIVIKLPDVQVVLEFEEQAFADGDTNVSVSCGAGSYQMRGLSASEFPSLPLVNEDKEAVVPVELLLSGLSGSLFAASSDETKQVLTGVHVSARDNSVEFAATDGHRLAVVQTEQVSEEGEAPAAELTDLEVTVPARALRELERILNAQGKGLVTLHFDTRTCVFSLGDQESGPRITSRLLDGQYPNYRQLIPRSFERQMTVERKALLGALERISVLADQRNNIVKLSIDGATQEVALSVDAPDVGSGREVVPVQMSGDDLEIAFNVKYLAEGLKALSSNEIQMQLNSPTSPAVLTPVGALKMTYLIMPVQIRSA